MDLFKKTMKKNLYRIYITQLQNKERADIHHVSLIQGVINTQEYFLFTLSHTAKCLFH